MKCGCEILLEDWDNEERSQIPNFDCVLPSTGTAWPPPARFSNVPKLFGRISGDIVLFVSSKRRRLKAWNFAVILIFLPFATYEKTPALQNERVGVLGTAFRARKVFGTFEKRVTGPPTSWIVSGPVVPGSTPCLYLYKSSASCQFGFFNDRFSSFIVFPAHNVNHWVKLLTSNCVSQ